MVNLPDPGQANWDVPLNTALAELAQNAFTATEMGFVAWNYDPMQVTTSSFTSEPSGTVIMMRLPRITRESEINFIRVALGGGNATPTSGQNFAGLYNSTGTRVAQTADIGSSLATAGLKALPLAAEYVAAPGTYYVALLQNAATTAPLAVGANHSAQIANVGLPGAIARFTTGPTGQTSLPASITMASRTTTQLTYWAGVS